VSEPTDAPSAELARAAIEAPWREALSEAWAVIDFLAPEDDIVFGGFRREVARVVKARDAARALLAEPAQ
jgi:hypothetical protein